MSIKATITIAALNPFTLSFDGKSELPDSDALLHFLAQGGPPEELRKLIAQRRDKLAPISNKVGVVPGDQRIQDKLTSPLRYAYGAFLLGNFLGTIALCGSVCEMLTVLAFESSEATINGQPLSETDQRGLFGDKFEKLGQDRRTKILEIYRAIPEKITRHFDTVRLIRKKYLHLWSEDHSSLEDDAVKIFDSTIECLLHFFPQQFDHGKLVLEKRILKYLSKTGAVKQVEDEGGLTNGSSGESAAKS